MPRNAEYVYDSRAVANYLLAKARENGHGLTPLQLIKLVYLAHGWMLGLLDRPLLEDDVEAWQYGPVIRSLYRAVAGDRDPIYESIPGHMAEFDQDSKDVLDQVYEKYGRINGVTLSQMTHKPGTPWHDTWSSLGKNAVIPQDLIKEHFKNLAKRYSKGYVRAAD